MMREILVSILLVLCCAVLTAQAPGVYLEIWEVVDPGAESKRLMVLVEDADDAKDKLPDILAREFPGATVSYRIHYHEIASGCHVEPLP